MCKIIIDNSYSTVSTRSHSRTSLQFNPLRNAHKEHTNAQTVLQMRYAGWAENQATSVSQKSCGICHEFFAKNNPFETTGEPFHLG